jgi:hypothetical protein
LEYLWVVVSGNRSTITRKGKSCTGWQQQKGKPVGSEHIDTTAQARDAQTQSSSTAVRKPYTQPGIIHELMLETQATMGSIPMIPSDPESIDPPLAPKPSSGGGHNGGVESIDPPLAPQPARRGGSEGGGGSEGIDPPLAPKP